MNDVTPDDDDYPIDYQDSSTSDITQNDTSFSTPERSIERTRIYIGMRSYISKVVRGKSS